MVRVAKFAGVSTSTVSRVLNPVPAVSQSTARTVTAVIQSLSYDRVAACRGYSWPERQPLRYIDSHGSRVVMFMSAAFPERNAQQQQRGQALAGGPVALNGHGRAQVIAEGKLGTGVFGCDSVRSSGKCVGFQICKSGRKLGEFCNLPASCI